MSRPRKVVRSSNSDPTSIKSNAQRRKDPEQKREMVEFLREYRRQEVLWNSSLPSYSQQNARQEAIQAMADNFDLTVEQVKRKIHTTRSTYNQMRVKVLQAEAEGRVYQPMLSWYADASFLDSVITLRKNRDSLPLHSTSRTSATESPPRIKRIRTSGPIRVKVKPETGELLMEDDTAIEEYHHQIQDYEQVVEEEGYDDQGGIEIIQQNNSQNTTTASAAEVEIEPPPPPQPPVVKDEIALFCDLMDSQLRALSTATGIETMCKVQSLITQARLEALMEK